MVSINTLIELYESGLSIAKVASIVDETPAKVWYMLKKAGIKRRSKKEALQYLVRYNTCIICGKSFRAREAYNKGNLYRQTCGDECLNKLRSQVSKDGWTEERKQYMSELYTGRDTSTWNISKGNTRPNWKGGYCSRTYRRIAFKEYGLEPICNKCGSKKNIVVHHRDYDRTNNDISNLEILCKECHTSYHDKKGDSGVNGKNGYNLRKK